MARHVVGAGSRRSPGLVVAAALIAFLVVAAYRSRPADPESRLPGRYRLADLIEQQTASARHLRSEVSRLRDEVDAERQAAARLSGGAVSIQQELDLGASAAGMVAVSGSGLRVTLDDSSADQPPSGGNVNDLVIHSQDVQAVVNAMWRSGAEAVSINGQRLVGTSAVLCVGNTLLLNGTVHSPPYVVSAVGASKERFDEDRLVRRLRGDASTFKLTFSVERQPAVEVPAYRGSTKLSYAQPAD